MMPIGANEARTAGTVVARDEQTGFFEHSQLSLHGAQGKIAGASQLAHGTPSRWVEKQ